MSSSWTFRRAAAIAAAATMGTVALAGPPAIRRVCRDRDPEGTGYAEYARSKHDPWGQPFVTRSIYLGTAGTGDGGSEEVFVERPWTPGPDGVDDGGHGDDLVIMGRCLTGVDRRWELAYAHALGVSVALAVYLAWAFTAAWQLAAARSTTAREVARSLLIASALGPWCIALGVALASKVSSHGGGPVVPPGLAIAGTTWLVAWLAVLALRLRRAAPT